MCVCVRSHTNQNKNTNTHTRPGSLHQPSTRSRVSSTLPPHTPTPFSFFLFFFFLSFFLKHLTSYALSFFISRSLCLCVFVLISSKFYDSFHLYYFFYKERLSGTVFLWNCLRVWLVDFLAFGFFFISRYQLFNIVSFCFLICGFCYI